MGKLSARQLTLIRRAAEDAIHACNRHYSPFVDVVAHPLNITALVDMAQESIRQKGELKELQEEFAEDERFLKEQIQQKDLEISNLKYLQGMDKDLIQTLQGKSENLQKRVFELEGEILLKALSLFEKTFQENKELQKRVEAVKKELSTAKEGYYGLNQDGADIECFIFDLEQALKGEE
ncbi:hypothetical protein [Acinetobacter lactucae]|uniref:hypothetical protein n=1 Tax=Acinetobacter lactucae TaxID=1785128 RepID=UPI001C2E6DAF|nr:hypothetical protein [Acinetobacter lactucae]